MQKLILKSFSGCYFII